MIGILSKHLDHFQKDCSSKTGVDVVLSSSGEIVLYREAIEHCARLYRIMVSVSFIESYTVMAYYALSLVLHTCRTCLKHMLSC